MSLWSIHKNKVIKMSDTKADRPVICKDCTKRIGKHYDESYYKIGDANYCNECIKKYKKYI